MRTNRRSAWNGRFHFAYSLVIRVATAIGLSLTSTFWAAYTPAIAQAAALTPASVTSLIGAKSSHGPEVKPINLDIDVRRLPSHTGPTLKKVFPHPLGLKSAGSTPAAVPSLGTPLPAPLVSTSTSMPAPSTSFNGLDFTSWGSGWPPDPVGDVGPNYYAQAVNTSIGIFNKTGTRVAAFTFDDFWSTAHSGTACDASNMGDPTIIYDPIADRWIIGDFAFTGGGSSGPYYECIAVSKTSDPVSGGWWLYPIRTDDLNHPWFADYPKMGIWPDGLYMTANMFQGASTFQEVRVWAFNRADLESGASLHNVIFDLNNQNYFSLLPSNLRGSLPPSGRENLLVSLALSGSAIDVFKFHVDYIGTGSTFTGPAVVSLNNYSNAANTVPTPGNSVDSIGDRLMMQAQYRNFDGVESIWINHTVKTSSSGPAGIQWAQIKVSGGAIITTPVQQQIYGNLNGDGVGRWLGSLAVDNSGNMAIGYSAASSTVNPDIRYAGRLVSDPQNTLPQGETTLLAGITRATQSGGCGGLNPCDRWGDYSAMTLDPDGCTFWYTNEYYETNGVNWQTRIGSFKFPACTSATMTITMKKSASPATYDHAGQVINYTYTVTNTTLASLQNTITISDNKLGTINNCGTVPLVPNAHTSCTTAYTTIQADLDAGSITNQATAATMINGVLKTSAPSSVTVNAIQIPALSLAVSPSPMLYNHVGEVINYTYTIANIGNVTLPGPFTVTDSKLNPPSPCGSGPLAPAGHTSCSVSYQIIQADFNSGSVSSTAAVSTTYNNKVVVSQSTNTMIILARVKLDMPLINK